MKRKISIIMSALALFSLVGCSGANGKDGINGKDGVNGEDGISIVSIELTDTEGLEDTYTITYSNNSTSTFVVTNGADGAQGIQGEPGKDGHTPIVEINENGYWVIDGEVTEILAKGEKGDKGDEGAPGKDGTSCFNGRGEPNVSLGNDGDSYIDTDTWNFYVKVEGVWIKKGNIKGDNGSTPDINIGENGNWFIDGVDTDVSSKGEDGKFIEKIEYKSSFENVDIYTITFSDGSTIDFEITHNETPVEEAFSISLDPNGGTLPSYFIEKDYQNLEKGAFVRLPTPYREGFKFDGWYMSKTYRATKVNESTYVYDNLDLVARWIQGVTSVDIVADIGDIYCENIINYLYCLVRPENLTTEINNKLESYLDRLWFESIKVNLNVIYNEAQEWLYTLDADLTILDDKFQHMVEVAEPVKSLLDSVTLENYYEIIEKVMNGYLTNKELIELQNKISNVVFKAEDINNFTFEDYQARLKTLPFTLDETYDFLNTILSNLETSIPTGPDYLAEYKDDFEKLKEDFIAAGSTISAYTEIIKFKLDSLFDEIANEIKNLIPTQSDVDKIRGKVDEYAELTKEELISKYELDYGNYLLAYDQFIDMIKSGIGQNSKFLKDSFLWYIFNFCEFYLSIPANCVMNLNCSVKTNSLFEPIADINMECKLLELTDITDIAKSVREKGFDFDRFRTESRGGSSDFTSHIIDKDSKTYFIIDLLPGYYLEYDVTFYIKIVDIDLARQAVNDYFENTIVEELRHNCTENNIDFTLFENEINDVKEAINTLEVGDYFNDYLSALSRLKAAYNRELTLAK